VADFYYLVGDQTLRQAVINTKGKLIVKSRTGGYDGRGNMVYKGQKMVELNRQLGDKLYAEQMIDFERELSVIAARGIDGEIAVYPTVETVHEDNICHTVLAPAKVNKKVHNSAQEIAHETLRHLGGAGIFAIEMFQVDDDVIINEIAPRVHNSGHFTIEACQTSQFEQHIRAITGMPLGSTEMRTAAAVMINILGTRDEPLSRSGLERTLALPDTHPHFYGKDPRPARKVGHITVLAESLKEAETIAIAARENFRI
jgi:phosphoribosylaminoimidazole carboxylase PurK protein